MEMERDKEQKIYFHGYFYNEKDLDDCIETLTAVVEYMQEMADYVSPEEDDLKIERDHMRILLELFSSIK